MILSQIRDYIKARELVSLEDLINHFDLEESALLQMLDVWQQKGTIHQKVQTGNCNSSCTQCPSAKTIYYAWGAQQSTETVLIDACSIRRN